MNLLAAALEVWFLRVLVGCLVVGVSLLVIGVAIYVIGWWQHRRDMRDWE